MTISKYYYIKVETKEIVSTPFVEIQRSQTANELHINVIYADNICTRPNRDDFSEALWQKFFPNDYSPKSPIIIVTHKEFENGNRQTLFDNSNIWIRIVYQGEDGDITEQMKKAIDYFTECYEIGLYKQDSAEEYINHHLRIQKENYLSGSHNQIQPDLYSSEILSENGKEYPVSDISIRMLLIDDKIKCEEFDCSCEYDPMAQPQNENIKNCKLRIIRDLLRNNNSSNTFMNDCTPLWNTAEVKSYHVTNQKIQVNQITNTSIRATEYPVQIVGVKDIESAKQLMANASIKFDLVLLDYCFHKEVEDNYDYGTELLKFIEKQLEEDLCIKVRSNAGLENRFWIFPITAFTSSFLTQMQCDGISLLTNKWYIYPPTNPIVTPVRFRYNLNEFIGMMVDKSVFTAEVLLGFFKKSIKEISSIVEELNFEAYTLSMGAEYQRFIQLYGSRSTIARDKKVSLFSKSVYDQFYTQKENSKIITLNNHLRKFYYASAFLVEEREGWEQLRKSWDILSCYLTKHFNQEITQKDIDIKLFNAKLSKLIQKD